MADKAEHGASVEAIVGMIIVGIFNRKAIALPASISFPPPVAMILLMSTPLMASTWELISVREHSPPNMRGTAVIPEFLRLVDIFVPTAL